MRSATTRSLTIGVQTFCTLRERDCYFLENTAYIKRLLGCSTRYALLTVTPTAVRTPLAALISIHIGHG